jgi:cytochrome o ubiquinol oxidase operon protein cyoD
MTDELSLKEIQKEWHGSLKAYVIGFFSCLLLTLISFSIVYAKLFSLQVLFYTLIGLAIVQAIVQLLFFLHVGQEAKPRWETISFCFMVMCLLIIVIGSLWVLNDLKARVMPEMNKKQHQEKHSHD